MLDQDLKYLLQDKYDPKGHETQSPDELLLFNTADLAINISRGIKYFIESYPFKNSYTKEYVKTLVIAHLTKYSKEYLK